MSGNIAEASSHPISSPRRTCQPSASRTAAPSRSASGSFAITSVATHPVGRRHGEIERSRLLGVGERKRRERTSGSNCSATAVTGSWPAARRDPSSWRHRRRAAACTRSRITAARRRSAKRNGCDTGRARRGRSTMVRAGALAPTLGWWPHSRSVRRSRRWEG